MDYSQGADRLVSKFSGYEEASWNLRLRILQIVRAHVSETVMEGHDHRRCDTFEVLPDNVLSAAKKSEIILNGTFDQVFSLVEDICEHALKLDDKRSRSLVNELAEAFRLSGSVYAMRRGRLELIPSEETARKLKEIGRILEPYQGYADTFFAAVGDLMGRKREPDYIVNDLFLGAEGYLKHITGENDFGSAVKALNRDGLLNTIQRGVMEKLCDYGSEKRGVGNSTVATEQDALWFLVTMLAQLTHIHHSLPQV